MSSPTLEASDNEYQSCDSSLSGEAMNDDAAALAASPLPAFYCEFCEKHCRDNDDFRSHVNSVEHRTILLSDRGKAWRHRPPPRGVPAEEYTTCLSHQMYGQCRLGAQCCQAHSAEELEEWKERHVYRRTRMQKAQEQQLEGYHQYCEELLRRFSEAKDPAAMNAVMTDQIKGLRLVCRQPLKLTVSSKETQHVWEFCLQTITPVRKAVLLRDSFRSHFFLKQVQWSLYNLNLPPDCQEWVNSFSHAKETKSVLTYTIKVGFRSSMYATYNQTLALDFGGFPVLVQHLSVDTVPADTLGDLQRQRRLVVSGESRWTPATVDLVPCGDWDSGVRRDSMADPLARLYPVPDAATFQLTQAVLGDRLTKEAYVARMHQLLYVEEMARADIVARYNIKVFLDIVDTITSSSANASDSYYAQGGELYAKLNLESELTDDTPAGRLVLQNCRLLWLSSAGAPHSTGRKRRVYEAPIEITKKKCVYLRLSKQCVEELQLKPRTEFEAEVQFLLDRISLCEMHYAVDRLSTPALVFPDFKVKPPTFDPCNVLDWDPRLNSQQRRAVACVVAPRTAPGVPPVIVVGPFGTGKTFTLAQAMLQVLRQEGTRVLVCTHSNSAADLYVLDYLDKLVHNQPEARPLRVLYQYRFPTSMDKRMLQYCLQVPREQQTKSGPWFRAPTREELEAHRVIITTLSSSKMLLATGIERGFFTHIFVDEAAQAMETECILPLSLADSSTRIVLAGDYMQLNPEVYSVFTRERRLHVSLLERLHDLYPDDHPCKVVLCDNYRSHEALVRYTSESFYKRRLVAAATPGPHHILYPLSFFAARGCDVPRDGSTSYVNDEEVNEIRDVVARLVETWPQTWGPRKLSQIAVVTPYFDQVQSIRTALRSRRLNEVKVESVANVQGKEFRAVVLSTVRTRATCLRLERSTPVKEALDFGFLSNAKLLNTAITRAQSLVVVVGDPVSLCSIGACQKLWETFVKTCSEHHSLHYMTWEEIKYQLDGFELQKEYGLNPHAESFWPSRPFFTEAPSLQTQPQGRPATGIHGNGQPRAPYYSYGFQHFPGHMMTAIDRRFCGAMLNGGAPQSVPRGPWYPPMYPAPPPQASYPQNQLPQQHVWPQQLTNVPRNQPQQMRPPEGSYLQYQQGVYSHFQQGNPQFQQGSVQFQQQVHQLYRQGNILQYQQGSPLYEQGTLQQQRPQGNPLYQRLAPSQVQQLEQQALRPEHQQRPQVHLQHQAPPMQPQPQTRPTYAYGQQQPQPSQTHQQGQPRLHSQQPTQQLQRHHAGGVQTSLNPSASDYAGHPLQQEFNAHPVQPPQQLVAMEEVFARMMLDDDTNPAPKAAPASTKQTKSAPGAMRALASKPPVPSQWKNNWQHKSQPPSQPSSQPSSRPSSQLGWSSNGLENGFVQKMWDTEQQQVHQAKTHPTKPRQTSNNLTNAQQVVLQGGRGRSGPSQTRRLAEPAQVHNAKSADVQPSSLPRHSAKPIVAYVTAALKPVTWETQEQHVAAAPALPRVMSLPKPTTAEDVQEYHKLLTQDNDAREKDALASRLQQELARRREQPTSLSGTASRMAPLRSASVQPTPVQTAPGVRQTTTNMQPAPPIKQTYAQVLNSRCRNGRNGRGGC